MKKFLLLLTVLLSCLGVWAEGYDLVMALDFSNKPFDAKISSYDGTFTADNGKWEIQKFNNNNSQWTEVKCGKSKTENEPCIFNLVPTSDVVDRVKVTIGSKFTIAHIKEAKIVSATDAYFTNNVVVEDFTKVFKGGAVGNVLDLDLSSRNPDARYYKLALVVNNTTTSNGSIAIAKIEFKKKPDSLSFLQDEYSVVLNDYFPAPVVHNPNSVEITNYTSSDENVATVDSTTGIVTLVNFGTTVITAESETETAQYTLNVTKKNPGIHYHDTEFSVDIRTKDPILPEIMNPEEIDLDKKVRFTSSDETVATVDDATGKVTLVGLGKTMITATFLENEEYASREASYTLTVLNLDELDETFDFVTDSYGQARGDNNKYLTEGVKFTQGTITVEYVAKEGGNGIRFWSDGLRVYSNVVMGITNSNKDLYISKISIPSTDTPSFYVIDSGSEANVKEWTNTDPKTNSVSLMLVGVSGNKPVTALTVELSPMPIAMTPGGYFDEPVTVLISGHSENKTIEIYYFDGDDDLDEVQEGVGSIYLEKNATLVVSDEHGHELQQTYIFSREYELDGSMKVEFNEAANAFEAHGTIAGFRDKTGDEENFDDIRPDGFRLYIDGVEIGEVTRESSFDLDNIMPSTKVEIVAVKEDAERKVLRTDISSQISWDMGPLTKVLGSPSLKMGLVEGAKHVVNHDKDNQSVFSALRLTVDGGDVKALKDLPYEFVVHSTSHEQGEFKLFNFSEKEDVENYEIHYTVAHEGTFDSPETFYKSTDATVSVEATLGFRFVANSETPAPQGVRRRAAGDEEAAPAVPTQVYVRAGDRSKFTQALSADNSQMSGVESVAADASADAVEYFNLQGIRLNSEPESGLYIRRQGTQTSKVVR